MAKFRVIAAALLMASGLAHTVRAQCASCAAGSGQIRVVRIPSAFGQPGAGAPQDLFCTSAGADFTINLAAYSWSTDDWVIHVYDCASSSTPAHNIGKVTINGDPTGINSLAVLVAGPSQSWSDGRDDPLDTGAVNFSGLTISDPDVRAKTRVSVAISGDLTQVHTAAPSIHANQIVRIQAQGRAGPSSTWIGGNITGPITADGAGTLYNSSTDAIGQVRAWNSITGDITASDKNIAAVRIVADPASTPAAAGIQGDIIAAGATGRIASVFSTGPIGNATSAVNITAGNGIGQIKTVAESDENTVLARDAHANVTANATMIANPATFVYSSPDADGPLDLLEVGGDLRGEVKAANIVGSSTSSAAPRRGIFVRGICYAPIDIRFTVNHANIVAQTFTQPVRVGRTLQGALVATGGVKAPVPALPGFLQGHIPHVTIGDLDDTEVPTALLAGSYSTNARGLVGIFGFRNSIPDGEAWFAGSTPTAVGSALDACVRAQNSIGVAEIASLTTQ